MAASYGQSEESWFATRDCGTLLAFVLLAFVLGLRRAAQVAARLVVEEVVEGGVQVVAKVAGSGWSEFGSASTENCFGYLEC